MTHVSFEEYEAAKAEIIGGVHYKEKSTLEGNVIRKTYATEENGTFYEVNDGGRIEFWSDKHPDSRIYDENERADLPENVGAVPGYGDLLAEKIRETADFANLKPFEKFVLDNGYLYDSSDALKAGYDRAWKAQHGITLTEEEFAAEVMSRGKLVDASGLYEAVMEHVNAGRLTAGDVMQYAHYRRQRPARGSWPSCKGLSKPCSGTARFRQTEPAILSQKCFTQARRRLGGMTPLFVTCTRSSKKN